MPNLNSQRIRLFKNSYLERLTLISMQAFALTWGLTLPFVAWVGWRTTSPLDALALICAGILVWTLFEYVMHRYLFHLKLDHPASEWFVFLLHGNHHDNPNDPLRGMMPLLVSVPVASSIWAGLVMLLGERGTWAFLGFAIGYVTYDTIHYASHQWQMRGVLVSALKRHHMRHHYVDDSANFAISAIFLDRVFGTRMKSAKLYRPGFPGGSDL